ncbi:MAG: metal-dependent hydrolase, partial [bacterium]|nr:metal-dependent hydrolase [bacterium]
MSLPLGHAIAGITAFEMSPGKREEKKDWKWFLFAALLANLADFDMALGLFLKGDANLFHRGATHSLVFSLLIGGLASSAWRMWDKIPRISFRAGFFAVFSHVLLDTLFTSSPISLFWPFQWHRSTISRSWQEIMDKIILESYTDAAVIVCCILILFLRRYRRLTEKGYP